MLQTVFRIVARAAASLVAFAVLAAPTYGTDGVVLINQAVVLNGNVTPGDAPGFPVTISVPGSYRLSSNLTVPDADTKAISVEADDVTIDLNGFSIIGPIVCTEGAASPGPLTCNQSGLGSGISTPAPHLNTKVFNGTIRGMGFGLLLGSASIIENVTVISNRFAGIGSGGVVNLCAALFNGDFGIGAQSVTGSSATGNGGTGILVRGTAVNNIATFNGQQGISAGCPSTVVSNHASDNAGGDIFTSGAGCVRANNTPAP